MYLLRPYLLRHFSLSSFALSPFTLRPHLPRSLSSLLLSTLLLLAWTPLATAMKMMDRTVAIVEDTVILESEVDQRLAQLQIQRPELQISDKIKRDVLNQLILERLQIKVAERVRLTIKPAELDDAVDSMKRRLSRQGVDFTDYLQQVKLSEGQLRESLKNEMMIRRIQRGNINRRIRVTEREVDEFLNSKAGQEWLKPRFRLKHILLPVDNNSGSSNGSSESNESSEAKAIAVAQSLIQRAEQQGEAFEELAKQYSKGPNAAKGGSLGWREKTELPALFVQQVATLSPGDITPPFRSNAGIHILQLDERNGAEPVIVQRYLTRHILVKPTELFTDAEARAKIDQLYQQLLGGADFIELAKEQTDDTGSKADGGSLGWSTPGQFVPEFERTMTATAVGEISKPFRSQFGWHILKVEDTKVEDMFDTVKRNQVVNILRQRRFQDELQLWLEEIREGAYVEVLI